LTSIVGRWKEIETDWTRENTVVD